MKRIGAVFLLLWSICLTAPFVRAGTPPAPVCDVVVRIEITGNYEGGSLHRRYTSQKKLHSVLSFLRLNSYRGKPEEIPERGDHYEITVLYASGRQLIFELQDYRYFSPQPGKWEKADPRHAHFLFSLIHLLPSDIAY